MSKEKLYKKLLQHEEEYFTLVDKMRNFEGLTKEEYGRYRWLKNTIKLYYNDILKNY